MGRRCVDGIIWRGKEMKKNCNECEQKDSKICHQGLPVDECPKRRLENEKLIYGALLLFAVTILVFSHCC